MQVLLVTSVYSLLVALFTIYLVYKHAHKAVPFPVKFFTFLGWFLGFSIIAFLPLDILIVSGFTHTQDNFRNKEMTSFKRRNSRSKPSL